MQLKIHESVFLEAFTIPLKPVLMAKAYLGQETEKRKTVLH